MSACGTPRQIYFNAISICTYNLIKRNHFNCFNYSQSQGSCQDSYKNVFKSFIFVMKFLEYSNLTRLFMVLFLHLRSPKGEWKFQWPHILLIYIAQVLPIHHNIHIHYIFLNLPLHQYHVFYWSTVNSPLRDCSWRIKG